jgi:hypothetical protein
MRRKKFPGLYGSRSNRIYPPDGAYLVRVTAARHAYSNRKPYLSVEMQILEPLDTVGGTIPGRIYCTPKTLWKLAWFLKDFGYESRYSDEDEIDTDDLVGCEGVVRISQTTIHGTTYLNLDAFAPAQTWDRTVVPRRSEAA